MKNRVQPIKTLAPVTNLSNRSPWRSGFFLIPLALASFALIPSARAVTPAPDGGYAGANTAEGTDALFSLASNGLGNTAVGYKALYTTTNGNYNTANGRSTLYNNRTGSYNTANGLNALFSNTDGGYNTATGGVALASNTAGNYNTADGYQALALNTMGISNTAIGHNALFESTGNNNIALGASAGADLTTGNNNIDIGNTGVAGESNREFLKEHKKVEEQQITITQLTSADAKQEVAIAQQQKSFEATIAQQQKQIETITSVLQEQALQIEKVSARLTANQSGPRTVLKDQLKTNQ
jgi:hypothetical protein